MRFGGSRRRRVWRRTWPLPRDAAADTSATHQGAPTGCAATEESTELAGPMSSAWATGLASRWCIEMRSRVMGSPGILRPGERRYDEERRVWNAMVDRRPALIAGCSQTADVVAAVALARRDGLEIGVRCGGHSVVGHAVPDGGLMIDLTPMGGVRVDPERQRAWVQGGALLGALDAASQRHGLATTAGNVSHTGVGGLTLGGGMGWLARQYGLACDNVLSYQVVLASGDTVRASEAENADLYWALRGGGGNFGVVTEFEFLLHRPGTQALLPELYYPPDDAPKALRGWRDLLAHAPRGAPLPAWVGTAGDWPHLPAELRG